MAAGNLAGNQRQGQGELRKIKKDEDMQITEAPAAVLAKPSKTPIIQPGQWATNGIGWSVETLTPNGWKPCGTSEEPIIFDDRERAEAWTAAFREVCPTREFRTAEAIEGWI